MLRMKNHLEQFPLLAIAFCAATMIANIMSLRMIAPFGVVMDAGALLYPATFVIRDAVHRRHGLDYSNSMITVSVLCNVVMFALFALTAWLPADAMTGPQKEFGVVLMPGVLIVLGSVVGQFVSERLDGRIYQLVYQDGQRSAILAAFLSNLVSIPLDSILMCGIAFGMVIPLHSVVLTIGANVVIKYLIMLISLGLLFVAERASLREG